MPLKCGYWCPFIILIRWPRSNADDILLSLSIQVKPASHIVRRQNTHKSNGVLSPQETLRTWMSEIETYIWIVATSLPILYDQGDHQLPTYRTIILVSCRGWCQIDVLMCDLLVLNRDQEHMVDLSVDTWRDNTGHAQIRYSEIQISW